MFVLIMMIGAVMFPARLTLAGAKTPKPIGITLYSEENYVPYVYRDGDQVAGIYVSILREAFARMPKYDLDIELVPFKRGLKMLEQGEIMSFFPPYKRKDRTWVERYSVPILSETVVVVCSKDFIQSHMSLRFPDDFKGATFATTSGYLSAGEKFYELVAKGDITLDEANTTASGLRYLMAGRVDCYLNERMAILAANRELNVDKSVLRLFGEAAIVGQEFGYVTFGPDPNGNWPYRFDFADELDDVLSDMRNTGVIDQLVVEYFSY